MSTDNLNEFAKWFIQDYMQLGGVHEFNDDTITPIIDKFKQSKTIPKKEYEVQCVVVDGKSNFWVQKDGAYRCELFGVHFNLECLLSNGGKITSVKRLSDGEAFHVGDMVLWDWVRCNSSFFIIEGFRIEDEKLEVSVNCGQWHDLIGISKSHNFRKAECKNPILTENNNGHVFDVDKLNEQLKILTTPCLSVNDVMDFFRKHYEATKEYNPSHGTIRDGMVYLAKQKLNTK